MSFEELLKQSDFVIVCSALNAKTRGIFNLEAFKKMKRNAIFINVSRSVLVLLSLISDDFAFNAVVALNFSITLIIETYLSIRTVSSDSLKC